MKRLVLPLLLLAFGANASVQDKLAQCAQLTDNGLRLACYDALAKQIKSGKPAPVAKAASQQTSKAIGRPEVVASTEDMKARAAANFGMEEKVQEKQSLDQITAVVVSIKKNPYGRLTLVLNNDQVWRQISSGYSGIRSGDKVILKKGVFGAVYMRKDGENRSISVKREK